MLRNMSAAEAFRQTLYLIEQREDEKVWDVWLHKSSGELSFEEYKKALAKQGTEKKSTARRISPQEEAATLEYAAQFITFT